MYFLYQFKIVNNLLDFFITSRTKFSISFTRKSRTFIYEYNIFVIFKIRNNFNNLRRV